MKPVTMILGIVLFALATAILYAWGLKKSLSQPDELARILKGKCTNRIVSYLKRNGKISKKELLQQIKGVQAGQFYSKKRIAVQDPSQYAESLIPFLIEQQLIEPTDQNCYRLKE